ncbi:lysophospholipid acyltransferase family protein [Hugenholtzia roseola]|uniref:lysophospholipid acyltransferase family protein n=1 Tax=Hugenholtzia roseola TaxID=1002 RepID=UPI000408AC48|nr:DUF374 domain-containing protein [Hugenholtzia roseola]
MNHLSNYPHSPLSFPFEQQSFPKFKSSQKEDSAPSPTLKTEETTARKPFRFRAALYYYGHHFFAFCLLALLKTIYWTCRIEYKGEDQAESEAQQGALYALWHENWVTYFGLFSHQRQPKSAVMLHPARYMKPSHTLMRWLGYDELILGSTGNSGKEAFIKLSKLLKEGYNIPISPDGPLGPAKVLKKGALRLSLLSGKPIIPIQFRYKSYFRTGDWDKKIIPFPFSKFEVIYGKPIFVTEATLEQSELDLTRDLG